MGTFGGIRRYILQGHEPVECPDLLTWADWIEKGDAHIVKVTAVTQEVRVSTVFLVLDHNFSGKGAPVLFETLIFGGPHDKMMWRYRTWEEAVFGHAWACTLAELGPGPGPS